MKFMKWPLRAERGKKQAKKPARPRRGRECLGRSPVGLDHAAMVLFADTHVEVHAEPDAEDVEVEVPALHGRRALPLEVADLEGVHRARLAEEVPRGLARAAVLRVREVRAGDDLEVLVGEDVQRRADRLLRAPL